MTALLVTDHLHNLLPAKLANAGKELRVSHVLPQSTEQLWLMQTCRLEDIATTLTCSRFS